MISESSSTSSTSSTRMGIFTALSPSRFKISIERSFELGALSFGQVLRQQRRQDASINRLADVRVASRAEYLALVSLHGVCGQSHDHQRCGVRIAPQAARQLQTVHPRQLDVEQDQ